MYLISSNLTKWSWGSFIDSLSVGWKFNLRKTTDLEIVNQQLLQVELNSNKYHHKFGNCNQAVTYWMCINTYIFINQIKLRLSYRVIIALILKALIVIYRPFECGEPRFYG